MWIRLRKSYNINRRIGLNKLHLGHVRSVAMDISIRQSSISNSSSHQHSTDHEYGRIHEYSSLYAPDSSNGPHIPVHWSVYDEQAEGSQFSLPLRWPQNIFARFCLYSLVASLFGVELLNTSPLLNLTFESCSPRR